MKKRFDVLFSSVTGGILLFLILALANGVEGSIGVNYGTVANNLPPPEDVAKFLLESTIINRVRLYDANPAVLRSFARTGIAITVTVTNEQITNLTIPIFAQQWIQTNILPHVPATNIVRILIGNEIVSSANKQLIKTLVPAMKTLHAALAAENLDRRIKISTPHSMAILASSSPPSNGIFKPGYDFKPMLSFLRSTNSPFLVNTYPFFGYSSNTLDYALFRPNPGVIDGNTNLLYMNMLDAQLDAVFSAMRRLGFWDIEIVVAETGWPSLGDFTQVGVNVNSAAEYNSNLMGHVNSGLGTPLMPTRTFETYIFALFNENLKPGPVSERNFGLFRPDMTPVYDVGILRATARSPSIPIHPAPVTESPKKEERLWCLPKSRADTEALQRNIDYVCGLGLDCRPIQNGGACFLPNTVRAHAAYAMNAYYQTTGMNDYDCDFDQTATVSDIDPSYGKCTY